MIAQYSQRTETVQANKRVYYYGSFPPLLQREQCLIPQHIDDGMAAAVEKVMPLLEMKHAYFPRKLL